MRQLSRERGKDVARDYARPPAVQLELWSENERAQIPKPTRSQAEDRLPAAVVRHARIVRDIRFAQSVGEPYPQQQRTDLAESRNTLDAIRPHARIDLETAMSVDHGLIREAADGKADRAIRAMTLESGLRVDPQLRADTFVSRWQALDRQRCSLLRDHETTRAVRVADTMRGMAKSLERDPQIESILRNRRAEFGLPEMPGRSIGRCLAQLTGRWRIRGLEVGI